MNVYDQLQDRHCEFIARQQVFFVGSAPLSPDGHVNVSPKGLDSFAIIDRRRVAYLDLGGSGIETQAHVQENGRLCIMFCAFEDKPLILRLYGRGQAHSYGSPGFAARRQCFPAITVPVRGILQLDLTRVQDSCGWGVPLYEYRGQRTQLLESNAARGLDRYLERRYQTNATSIDGLPGLRRPEDPTHRQA
jgi:Pyridoxamine 5'-phosphate oxidase